MHEGQARRAGRHVCGQEGVELGAMLCRARCCLPHRDATVLSLDHASQDPAKFARIKELLQMQQVIKDYRSIDKSIVMQGE